MSPSHFFFDSLISVRPTDVKTSERSLWRDVSSPKSRFENVTDGQFCVA
jgi:hypothetical protein